VVEAVLVLVINMMAAAVAAVGVVIHLVVGDIHKVVTLTMQIIIQIILIKMFLLADRLYETNMEFGK
jgi:hypothetical protein